MAEFHADLLAAAGLLLKRAPGQRGRLSRAHVRRAISTTYYALFHFAVDEACRRIVGVKAAEAERRRALARAFPHAGLARAFGKLTGTTAPHDIAVFLRTPGGGEGLLLPAFVRRFAKIFTDAQQKRHDADYDLNKSLSEADADFLLRRAGRAIDEWRAATSPADRDLKHMIAILLLLQGRLKGQD